MPKINKNYKNPVCVVLWQDAAFTYEKDLPKKMPEPQLTCGFIVSANDEDDFIDVAMNVGYDALKNTVRPIDGMRIPKRAIIEFKKIGNLGKLQP